MRSLHSHEIVQELIKQIPRGLSERQALIGGIFLSARPRKGRDYSDEILIDRDLVEYVTNVMRLLELKYITTMTSSGKIRIKIANESLKTFTACYDMCFLPQSADQLSSSDDFRRNFLKGVYLACGYYSDPSRSYRIELHLHNPNVDTLVIWMLHANDIEPTLKYRGETKVLRFREGDQVSTFLALIGATKAMLDFENVRAEREISGRVNRIMNCDVGNVKRQSDASARRTKLFLRLLESEECGKLPPELLAAAQVHINNPGTSIADLGKLMQPPIGKSGMNHRLIKLEEIAKNLPRD